MVLNYSLISDGPSDKVLKPILNWLIKQNGYMGSINDQFCDLRLLSPASKRPLSERILFGLELFPCELLFVHRDAERTSREKRVQEITAALQKCSATYPALPAICVIPVRMTEAWLLFNEEAIRRAVGNPHGQESFVLPPLQNLEDLPNPKKILAELLMQATGLNAHRRSAYKVNSAIQRITECIDDFSPLRSLGAFNELEIDIKIVLSQNGWV